MVVLGDGKLDEEGRSLKDSLDFNFRVISMISGEEPIFQLTCSSYKVLESEQCPCSSYANV
jgi:hypothetical protein